jgi:non-specific serine/threonine protein kinase
MLGQLKIMVTSRSVLDVYGEHNYPVPPLQIPPDQRPEHLSPDRLMQNEAVQLLVARARAVNPGFTITAANAAAIVTICRQLDGLPLAIELAAARFDIFTPEMLTQRLHHSLGLLNRGPQNVPDRLRTMRNAIAWSYDLLTPAEQVILRRLAIYLGNWTFADAEALTRTDLVASGSFDEYETLEILSSLVSKSLIRQVAGTTGGSQFRMLQTLREFNLEQLRLHQELEAVQTAQHTWLLDLAERAQPELTGHAQKEWLDRLEGLHANFRAAFSRLLQADQPELALRLARALWRFGYIRGYQREMREFLGQALARVPSATALRANALNGAGYLANVEGEPQRAREHHTEALTIGRAMHDHQICGDALMGLGGAAVELDDLHNGRRLYEQAASEFQLCANQRGLAVVSTNLGNLYQATGELARSRHAHEVAFQRYTDLGDIRGIAWSHTNIGHIASETGDLRDAVQHFEDAFRLYVDLGDTMGYIEILEAMALIAADRHDATVAATMLGAAAALRTRIHAPVQTQEQVRLGATIDVVREKLGQDETATHWSAGEALPDEAIRHLVLATAHDWLQNVPESSAPAPEARSDVSLGLTEREMEVLVLLAAGKSDRDIAEALYISVRTVGTHVSNILGKLDVPSRTAAVARARHEGALT